MNVLQDSLEAEALAALKAHVRPHRLPVDPLRIAQGMGIRVVFRALESREALYVRDPRQTRIFIDEDLVVNGNLSARGRFTLAHELGHHIFDEVGRSSSVEAAALPLEAREKIADRLGSNLLMPRDLLTAELHTLQPDWVEGDLIEASTVAELQQRFRVSLPALANALRDLSAGTLIARFEWIPNQDHRRASEEPVYRVVWSSPMSERGDRLFPNQSLTKYRELCEAAERGQVLRTRTKLNLRPLPHKEYSVAGAPHRPVLRSPYLLTIDLSPHHDQRLLLS